MPKPIKFETKKQRRKRRAQEVRLAVIASLSVFVLGMLGWQFVGSSVLKKFADTREAEQLATQSLFSAADDPNQPSLDLCGSGTRYNCVVDGDTIWLRGVKIRIADIDTPEVGSPRCDSEYQLGMEATYRLLDLLNEGPFRLEAIGSRDEDQYGRKLRVLTRNGASIGDILVGEGLARTWSGRREPWC